MSQYKDTSLKDLLENFINAQYLGAFVEAKELQDNAEDEMQEIAGELNRRFYITQQQNQALIKILDLLAGYFIEGYPNGCEENELAEELEQIKDQLQGEQP
jgi:hypothetical protein